MKTELSGFQARKMATTAMPMTVPRATSMELPWRSSFLPKKSWSRFLGHAGGGRQQLGVRRGHGGGQDACQDHTGDQGREACRAG